MFGALLRQEFHFTARSLGQILLWSAVFGLVSSGMIASGLPLLSQLGTFAMNLVLLGIVTATVIVMTVHYWRSMHGAYGPFTHSIPVSGAKLFIAKVTYFVLAVGASFIPTLFAALLMIGAQGISAGQSLSDVFSQFWDVTVTSLDAVFGSAIGMVLLFGVIASAIFSVVQLTGAITIGFSGKFGTRGVAGPSIALVVMYFLNQLAGFLGLLIVPVGIRVVNDTPQNLEFGMMLPEMLRAVQEGTDPSFVGLGGPLMAIPLGIITGWWAIRTLNQHLYVR